jgi:hypothetical protein
MENVTSSIEIDEEVELSEEVLKEAESLFLKNLTEGLSKQDNINKYRKKALENRIKKRRSKKKMNKKFSK